MASTQDLTDAQHAPSGHDPSADCWCGPEFWPAGPYGIGMTHRDVDPVTLARNWTVHWYREGQLAAVCCAARRCVEPAAVINASPQVHTPGQLAAIKGMTERAMRRDPLARYCPLHANAHDPFRPWHRVRVHFPTAALTPEHTIEESIRGLNANSAVYFAGLNWPAATRIDYVGLDTDSVGERRLSNSEPCAYAELEGRPEWQEHDHRACLDGLDETE